MMEMLNTLTVDELNQIVTEAQALLNMKKTEQRRNEIIAELIDLFAELDALDIEYYFGAPAKNGGTDCHVIIGDVVWDEDAIIIK